mgnify:CR=1 FL=1
MRNMIKHRASFGLVRLLQKPEKTPLVDRALGLLLKKKKEKEKEKEKEKPGKRRGLPLRFFRDFNTTKN